MGELGVRNSQKIGKTLIKNKYISNYYRLESKAIAKIFITFSTKTKVRKQTRS